MCGIVGKVFADPRRKVKQETLEAMCRALIHRGPDDEGYYCTEAVGLAMRRLQVIDLPGGQQPMTNEDGTLRIVFNGEIYNYQELRQGLVKRGHILQSQSDTETILHLYEEQGIDCLQELRGMFALALWDDKRRQLFLARDRLGKKPLYYSLVDGGFSFASELQALLQDPQLRRDVDPQAIDEYLTYLFVPHPQTIYRDVHQLPPASYAVFSDSGLTVKRYWEVEYRPTAAVPDKADTLTQLDSLLRQAVELRMLADVPVGAFLSGGLDSSLVVALMQQLGQNPVRTFAIGFNEDSFNELGYAREVAQTLGTQHEEFIVDYNIRDLMPQLIGHFGEPFADSSAIPAYHLAKVTRNEVTVALSGDGGDEVFGGYRRYQARMMAEKYNCWPVWAGRSGFENLVQQLHEPNGYYGQSRRKKLKRFVEYARTVRESPQMSWAFFLPKRKKSHFIRKILPIYWIKKVGMQVIVDIFRTKSTPAINGYYGLI